MGSYGTSFNINNVFFGNIPDRYKGIYDIKLNHDGTLYLLSSVLLYTVYNESLSQNPSDGLKIKGNLYAIVIQHDLSNNQYHKHIVYQPYVLSAFSHSISDESPISAFDTGVQNNIEALKDIVYRYGEIYVFRNLKDQLVSITQEFNSSVQNSNSSASAPAGAHAAPAGAHAAHAAPAAPAPPAPPAPSASAAPGAPAPSASAASINNGNDDGDGSSPIPSAPPFSDVAGSSQSSSLTSMGSSSSFGSSSSSTPQKPESGDRDADSYAKRGKKQ